MAIATTGNDSLNGTAGADTIDGLDGDDTISGAGGADWLGGGNGNDSLLGGAGNDSLDGGAGNDTLLGGSNDDYLTGGAGDDSLVGGGFSPFGDWASYAGSPSGVNVSLATGLASDGWGGTDTLVGIQMVDGSAFGDTLVGGSGNDQFEPRGGNDSVNGGAGLDAINYADAPGGVVIDMLNGVVFGASGNDTLVSIEAGHASRFSDVITMSNTGAWLFAQGGNDVVNGSGNDDDIHPGSGNDTVHGNGGFDIIDYSQDWDDGGPNPTGSGVNVNLVTGTATDNWGGTDTFDGIELAWGSPYADTLTGGNPVNGSGATDGFEGFQGFAGNDTISGGTGFDRIFYTASPAAVNVTLGGTSNGTAQDGWGGVDTFSSIEEVRGSSFGDTLAGSDSGGFESFEGMGGNDTIDGHGGTNRINFQTSPSGVNVDLATGTASDGWGGTDTFTNIENARGSDFSDTLAGDGGANQFEGRLGDDWMTGGAGNDTFTGGGGNDTIDGGANVQLKGITTFGATANGSDTFDFAVYTDATSGVTVTLGADGTAGSATGGGIGTDVLVGIEFVIGSNFGDVIHGSNRSDTEILRGGAGNDTLFGGDASGTDAGSDIVDYRSATSAVTVSLAAGTASGGDGNDVISGFEGLFGSSYNDVLTGDAQRNFFFGSGGNDTIDGGAGNDMVSYQQSPSAVTVDLAAQAASGGEGSDTFISIEMARGSEFDDALTGSSGDNVLQGRAGNDTIVAGPGQDTVIGGLGDDSLDGGSNTVGTADIVSYEAAPAAVHVSLASGVATGGEGNDTLAGFEGVIGSAYDDSLTGSAGDDTLRGAGGNDTIDGGAGNDTAVFSGLSSQYSVVLDSVTGDVTVSGPDGTDLLRNIEALQFDDQLVAVGVSAGTPQADTLEGGDGNDLLFGEGGDDDLRGGGGDDRLEGGEGNDRLDGDVGNDVLDGGTGDDTMTGGTGNDTYVVDSSGDVVVEPDSASAVPPGAVAQAIGSGIDTVVASIDYSLGGAIENLQLSLGSDATQGVGNAVANALTGNEAGNTLTGLAGNDTIDGGEGIDTSAYGGSNGQYTLTHGDEGWTVASDAEGTDSLENIERLQFGDVHVALDLDGNAGDVVKVLGAVLGPGFADNPQFVGIGLAFADRGLGYEQLMNLALNYVLGDAVDDSQAVVDLLWANVVGTPIDAGVEQHFMDLIDGGGFTPATLGMLAADTSFNLANIGFAGLQAQGVEYM